MPVLETITVRPIKDAADLVRVNQAARKQGHVMIAPSHVFERNGRIVGYASVNKIPVLTGFLHETLVTQDEGRECIAQLERIAEQEGARFVLLPCTEDCRFLGEMSRMGYHAVSKVTMFLKSLRI